MKIVQLKRTKDSQWEYYGKKIDLINPLVLVFGNRYLLEDPEIYKEVSALFPGGEIVFGSTSGEIISTEVHTDSITITAMEFEKSSFVIKRDNILENNKDSKKVGENLIEQFSKEELKHIFVISEGSFINGSELTEGLKFNRPTEISVTGGLCGDDARFEKTLASYNENPKEGEVIAIGLYGKTLEITTAINGGWVSFGPKRIITKSESNILYEVDYLPVLDLYKKYLGEKASELPASALLYPISVTTPNAKFPVVRTILNIDEEKNAMILAGNVPEGSKVQLMMTTVDELANAAETAAISAMENRITKPELVLIVSCIGRKLVLDQRVEDEIAEVFRYIDDDTIAAGFYSYGEISPCPGELHCSLHNQTLTLTLISE
ncbi:MAG: FIST N-terminal domain-containing protein [Flavobacteriaceae bacterium]